MLPSRAGSVHSPASSRHPRFICGPTGQSGGESLCIFTPTPDPAMDDRVLRCAKGGGNLDADFCIRIFSDETATPSLHPPRTFPSPKTFPASSVDSFLQAKPTHAPTHQDRWKRFSVCDHMAPSLQMRHTLRRDRCRSSRHATDRLRSFPQACCAPLHPSVIAGLLVSTSFQSKPSISGIFTSTVRSSFSLVIFFASTNAAVWPT